VQQEQQEHRHLIYLPVSLRIDITYLPLPRLDMLGRIRTLPRRWALVNNASASAREHSTNQLQTNYTSLSHMSTMP